jgi:peroxiredoxin Q/BCP
MARLWIGDRAPDFELFDQEGKPFRLHERCAEGPLVLYFYPKDETPGCTAEACAFRDQYEDFTAAGARVVGVSSDSVDSHRAFAARHRLPFTLLADPGGKLRAAFGVPKTLGLLDGRVTYVLDRSAVIRHAFSSQIQARRHVKEALGVVATLG